MKIILHCSDSPFGNAALLSKWHVLPIPDGRGWNSIGYHYVILNGNLAANIYNKNFDGVIETGRPLDDDNLLENFEYGAHTKGQNMQSVGICLIGNSNSFNPKQLNSLRFLLSLLKEQFGEIEISQHSDWEPKKPFCAGFTKEFIETLNKMYNETSN